MSLLQEEAKPQPAEMPVYTGRGGKYSSKPRVVVLGSGWGAMSFIKSLGSGGALSFLGNNRYALYAR